MTLFSETKEQTNSSGVASPFSPKAYARVVPRWDSARPVVRGGPEQVEVALAWGDVVLRVVHPRLESSFVLGEGPAADLLVPREILGSESAELLSVDDLGTVQVSPPAFAEGFVRLEDGTQMTLANACETGSSTRSGFPLLTGGIVRIHLGEFTLTVSSARRLAALPKGGFAPLERTPLAFFGMSFATFAGVLGGLAYFVPPLGLEDEDAIQKERMLDLSHYLSALAVREREQEKAQPTDDAAREGGSEAPSGPGAQGTLGKTTPVTRPGRIAVHSESPSREIQLARAEALAAVKTFGMIGLLNAGPSDALSNPLFARDEPFGPDDVNARGDLWSSDIGEAMGTNGLNLSGPGEGGGGPGLGVGVNGTDPFGKSLGKCATSGCKGVGEFGVGHGRPGGAYRPKARLPITGQVELSGRMPAEVIRRTVRQNFGRFRFCYEQGLARNPSLEGRVSVRFVIGRDGAVSNVGLAGSDLSDGQVTSCLQTAFYGLSFPQPENGIVRVTYPIIFSPE